LTIGVESHPAERKFGGQTTENPLAPSEHEVSVQVTEQSGESRPLELVDQGPVIGLAVDTSNSAEIVIGDVVTDAFKTVMFHMPVEDIEILDRPHPQHVDVVRVPDALEHTVADRFQGLGNSLDLTGPPVEAGTLYHWQASFQHVRIARRNASAYFLPQRSLSSTRFRNMPRSSANEVFICGSLAIRTAVDT